jgi:lysozyme family protein
MGISDIEFQKGLKFVLAAEGGYTNDPDDPGGPTNKGIIQAEYDLFRKEGGLAEQSVRYITEEEASAIYYQKYWLAAHCNGLLYGLNIVQMDCAVNMGVGTAIKILCRTLRIPEAVQFTPALSDAVHKLDGDTVAIKKVINGYLAARKRWYIAIVLRRPLSHRFLKGWFNRIAALSSLVNEVPT